MKNFASCVKMSQKKEGNTNNVDSFQPLNLKKSIYMWNKTMM